jgi:Na+-transporting methylmalonyl-CoA/oxaloacetate decarboxylase gamma subunit
MSFQPNPTPQHSLMLPMIIVLISLFLLIMLLHWAYRFIKFHFLAWVDKRHVPEKKKKSKSSKKKRVESDSDSSE